MIGHDAEYSNSSEDSELLTIAKKENRILLTRDFELYKHAVAKEVEAFYIEGQTQEQRLAALAEKLDIKLEINMVTSRCPKCNTQVKPISKEKVAGRVEKNTFKHYNKFWECPKCDQVYWQGAHWTKIRETLETAKQESQKEKRTGAKKGKRLGLSEKPF
jgi:uncharacterized protein with PIN domain